MLRKIVVIAIFFISFYAHGQQDPALIDSLKRNLAKAKTSEEKVEALDRLSRSLIRIDLKEVEKYVKKMTLEAELSRDRKLIVKALLTDGELLIYFGTKDKLNQSISTLTQGLHLAQKNKLEKEATQALVMLSYVHLQIPDLDKSLSYAMQASSMASALKNDSIQTIIYTSLGTVYQQKKEKLLALRNYLSALRVSEEIENTGLIRNTYRHLSGFYADVKDYEKAIDYAIKTVQKVTPQKQSSQYNKVTDLNTIGSLYSLKKDFDMAVYYFEWSIKLADTLKFEQLKVPGYIGIVNQYITADQPQKALEYFNANPEIKSYINNFGMPQIIDQAYGIIYTHLKKFDSAKFYMDKAEPQFEQTGTPYNKMVFYSFTGNMYKEWGNHKQAETYYLKAKTYADQTASLEWQQDLTKELDTVYNRSGDYKQSYHYSALYHQYKDSMQKLGEEKDLLQLELADEQQRQDRITKEKQAALDKKHNVQYMGITIGIATVFMLLVLLGMFRVSVTTIKVLGFFSFIFLFEFIILIADGKIHHWTHGEPLPILAIKVVLIAALLPFHHWLEHKVVSYLISRKMILPSGKNIWTKIRTRSSTTPVH